MLIILVIFVTIFNVYHLGSAEAAANYCKLCDGHIACKSKARFGTECSSDRAVLEFNQKQKTLILELHNRMRNKIALGKLKGYQPAERMPILQWDAELAYLAEINAKSCHYGHDTCRATVNFKYAGQNIARRGNTRDYENTNEAIEHMVMDWFNEYVDADMSYINEFRVHDEGKKIGHFTAMVNEKTTRIGCSLVRHQQNGFKYLYLVCNYSYTNFLGEPIYTPGGTGSRCETGPHRIYRGLCNENEEIIPEPFV